MALYQNNATSVNVGERLRGLRTARAMSMNMLATKSGLSLHTISLIERGKTSPSVSTLYKLADALNVSLTYFFSVESDQKQVIFLKADERTRLSFTRGLFEGLGGEQFAGRIEPFVLTLENSANSGPQTMSHTGHEFVFCLRGELEYQVEHDIYELSAGDSLLFAAYLKHRWKNPGTRVAAALIVISAFEDGEELRTMHWKKEE